VTATAATRERARRGARAGRAGAAVRSRWFLLPFASGILVLVVIPALLTGYYAFTDFTGLADPRLNGLNNVRRLLADPFFFAALRASTIHLAIAVPLRLAAATVLGLLLAAPRRGGRL
jgi:multiple sugar transport system permease protein